MKTFYIKKLKSLITYAAVIFLFSPSYGQLDSRMELLRVCGPDPLGGKASPLCSPGSLEGKIDKENPNEVEIYLVAHVVNLKVSSNGIAYIPEDYPALHLRYEYSSGVFKYTKKITTWTQVEEIVTNNGDVNIVYRANEKVKVLLPKNTDCDYKTSTKSFTIEGGLYTYSDKNNNWEKYPIYIHSGPEDIFSCNVFKETMHVCDPKLDKMELRTAIDVCIPCKKNSKQINILLNPFAETLDFEYLSENASSLTITLLSSDGRAILTDTQTVTEGNNRKRCFAQNKD